MTCSFDMFVLRLSVGGVPFQHHSCILVHGPGIQVVTPDSHYFGFGFPPSPYTLDVAALGPGALGLDTCQTHCKTQTFSPNLNLSQSKPNLN